MLYNVRGLMYINNIKLFKPSTFKEKTKMASSKNKNLPNWGGGRSGFTTPKTPSRISRRAATIASGATIKGKSAKKK